MAVSTRHKKAPRRRLGMGAKGMRAMTRAERVHALAGAFAHVPISREDHIAVKRAANEAEMAEFGRIMARRKQPNPRAAAARRKAGLLTFEERIRAVRGKYAWMPSSDDFIAEKHREIEKEEQKWRSS
jgi:hypothetical protein